MGFCEYSRNLVNRQVADVLRSGEARQGADGGLVFGWRPAPTQNKTYVAPRWQERHRLNDLRYSPHGSETPRVNQREGTTPIVGRGSYAVPTQYGQVSDETHATMPCKMALNVLRCHHDRIKGPRSSLLNQPRHPGNGSAQHARDVVLEHDVPRHVLMNIVDDATSNQLEHESSGNEFGIMEMVGIGSLMESELQQTGAGAEHPFPAVPRNPKRDDVDAGNSLCPLVRRN